MRTFLVHFNWRFLLLLFFLLARLNGMATEPGSGNSSGSNLADVLPVGEWNRVEQSVDRALAWLAAQQQSTVFFPAPPSGQPAITSLVVLAFLSRGHQPGLGPYGEVLDRAIDFVISCQDSDGLFSFVTPSEPHVDKQPSHTAAQSCHCRFDAG